MKKSITISKFILIPVEIGLITIFNSAIEKEQYKKEHKSTPSCSYKIYKIHAIENAYIIIDTTGYGSILNKEPLIYNNCIKLINNYDANNI